MILSVLLSRLQKIIKISPPANTEYIAGEVGLEAIVSNNTMSNAEEYFWYMINVKKGNRKR